MKPNNNVPLSPKKALFLKFSIEKKIKDMISMVKKIEV